MKNVRRLLDFGGKRRTVGGAKVTNAARSKARPSMTPVGLAPDSVPERERSDVLNQPRQTSKDQAQAPAEAQRGEWTEIPLADEGYAVVGERVGAVLTSANQAADQMRESARKEAERIKSEAADNAASTIAEASLEAERTRRESEELRAEADRYSKETREAADRYGTETRRKLDEEAAQRRAEAEERARRIRQAAEQKAKDLVTEAVHRQKGLVQEAGRSEARLQQLLGVFRGMTSQLEELVRAGPAIESEETEAEKPGKDGFEDALKPPRTANRRS